jgi:hypothetical protein
MPEDEPCMERERVWRDFLDESGIEPDRLHLVRAGSKARVVQWAVHAAPDGPPKKMSLVSLMSFPHPTRARA